MSAGKSEILIKTPINISSACTIQNFCGPLQQCTSAEYFLVAFIVCTWCSGAACRLHTLHSAPPLGGPNPDIDVYQYIHNISEMVPNLAGNFRIYLTKPPVNDNCPHFSCVLKHVIV